MGKKWLKTVCSVCGHEFDHTDDYRPSTCGAYECLVAIHAIKPISKDELVKRGVIKAGI